MIIAERLIRILSIRIKRGFLMPHSQNSFQIETRALFMNLSISDELHFYQVNSSLLLNQKKDCSQSFLKNDYVEV